MSAAAPTTPSNGARSVVPRGEDALYREFEASRTPGQIARTYLEVIRDEVAEHHFAGASGTEVVREYTAALDDLMW